MREKKHQVDIMLALSDAPGVTVFRNNVGLAVYPDGSRVVYGLCKGSSDLIGWQSIEVTLDMVGQKVAIFLAVEVKTAKKKPTKSQRVFLDAVADAGGISTVARQPSDLEGVLR